MNIVKKIYCRIYQTAFHAALPFLPYREPEIIGSINELADMLVLRGVKSLLLVTDAGIRNAGVTRGLEESLADKGINCAVYDKTSANPTVHNVEEAREIYIKEECECLVAFGGGSAMDCAKAVGARIAYPNRSLDKLKGTLRIFRKIPTLIAIPTTAGTGSEVTVTAVITDAVKKHKYTMNSFPLIPSYAVLDPYVTFTLPPHLTATTGMDALTHAVEAYIGNSTSKQTRKLSLDAVKLIFENIEKAYAQGDNREARENMLKASYYAGASFTKSYVGYVHAVAHSLGGQYNTPHGLANAVLMPIVLEEYGSAVYKKLYELGISAGVVNTGDTYEEGAKKFISAIRVLNTCMGIPPTLSGIKKADIPLMARHADKEANPLYPVPVLMDAKKLEEFYYKVADRSFDDE
ncbi:MAG: iron-containing alcohol dehydrogenase [Clostridia bacterium]|nr:iron-containing alcohol dehydrogenase [Clostridia bacterium]